MKKNIQPRREIIICRDGLDLANQAAVFFSDLAGKILAEKALCTVALSGGSTPGLLYERLLQEDCRKSIDWKRLIFFVGDERCVDHESNESNYGNAFRQLLQKLEIPQSNLHPTAGQDRNVEQAAARYEEEIRRALQSGQDEIPGFDIIFLGMGPDGHTASLFPGTAALEEKSRLVVKNHVDKFNSDRITFTFPLINQAANVIFLVCGKDKSEVLSEVFSNSDKYPCESVSPLKGRLIWFVDAAAASSLKI